MIPQVTMRWAQKVATCKYCDGTIEPGTPEITAYHKAGDGKSWNTLMLYHPECWIQSGLEYLKENPYQQQPTEVVKPTLTEEQKSSRQIILRKYASLRQRQRKLKQENPRYPVLFANIEAQIAGLMIELLPLGGVPRKWADG